MVGTIEFLLKNKARNFLNLSNLTSKSEKGSAFRRKEKKKILKKELIFAKRSFSFQDRVLWLAPLNLS